MAAVVVAVAVSGGTGAYIGGGSIRSDVVVAVKSSSRV
jgi:hypothetical protein